MGCERFKRQTVEDKGAFEGVEWGGEHCKKNNTPSLFASYIRCLSFKLLPRVFVRVCGKGVATHTELVVHKHTMRDTAAQKRERERLSKHYYYTNYR